MARTATRTRAASSRKKPAPARRKPAARSTRTVLLIGTRKGAFIYRGDPARKKWEISGPHFLGSVINHMMLDPRDCRTLLVAARTGHLGPTVFRSTDWGKRWIEAARPPAFRPVAAGENGRAVDSVFWLTPGHASQPGSWYAGTTPHGLFRSEDSGASWGPVDGFNEHPMYSKWSLEATPAGRITHSILIDPRDPAHLYVGLSVGGIFESVDGGRDWRPLNKGVAADFLPETNPEYGHDPHCMIFASEKPDRLYHQNHCGIYRLDRPGDTWQRIGKRMPASIGDIGFPIVCHPRDPDTVWVSPMDGTTVWPRTSPDGRPAVYRSSNAGRSWKRLDGGMPARNAWWTVLRQSFAADQNDPVGLYFGTTSGEIWMSDDEGERWRPIAVHLPQILSVECATV